MTIRFHLFDKTKQKKALLQNENNRGTVRARKREREREKTMRVQNLGQLTHSARSKQQQLFPIWQHCRENEGV